MNNTHVLKENAGEDHGIPNVDWFVYSYEYQWYEGSGFGIGKIGDKYFYHEMGHCSCYGPFDNIHSSSLMLHTLPQIEAVVENYGAYAQDVLNYIKTNNL